MQNSFLYESASSLVLKSTKKKKRSAIPNSISFLLALSLSLLLFSLFFYLISTVNDSTSTQKKFCIFSHNYVWHFGRWLALTQITVVEDFKKRKNKTKKKSTKNSYSLANIYTYICVCVYACKHLIIQEKVKNS